MLRRILNDTQDRLLAEAKSVLADLGSALEACAADRVDRRTLEQSIRQLDELFLLVIVGEFNAGKSTFINALVGSRLLEEGVTPTTSRIHRIRFGAEIERGTDDDGLYEVTAPLELLREVHIVDTPGTNALDREHEAITRDFVPRADLVLFVTSADRPFTDSERKFIEEIRGWGKKIVFVINKIDILENAAQRSEVMQFVSDNATQLLRTEPRVYGVAARNALTGRIDGDESRYQESGFQDLEEYLLHTLDERERIKLKLGNPLGVGISVAEQYELATGEGLALLGEDIQTLDEIDRQLELYKQDLDREFQFRLTDVDNLLHEFEKRGNEFFDETLRLPRALDLMNKSKVQLDFERQVIADTPQQIEQKVDEIIDWMVTAELRQWQGVSENLSRRQSEHTDRLIGKIGSFDYDRQQLLETVGRAAQNSFESYDQQAEAQRMAESVQTAVAGTALIEVGAIGLGAIVTMMAATPLADFTGILAAGTLAVLGLFVLPARRKQAKRELAKKILELRTKLMGALQSQFTQEVDRSVHRIRDAVAPYTRFVRAERQRLEQAHEQLEGVSRRSRTLREKIEEL